MKWLIALSAVVLLNILCDYTCDADPKRFGRSTSVFDRSFSSDEEIVQKRSPPAAAPAAPQAGTRQVKVKLVVVNENGHVQQVPARSVLGKFMVSLKDFFTRKSSDKNQCNISQETRVEVELGGQILDIPLGNTPVEGAGGDDAVNFQNLFTGITSELKDADIDVSRLDWPQLAQVIELLKNPQEEIQNLFKDKAYLSTKIVELLQKEVAMKAATNQAQEDTATMKLELTAEQEKASNLAINLGKEIEKQQELEKELKSVNGNLTALKNSEAKLKEEEKKLKAEGAAKAEELAEVQKELKGKLQEIEKLEAANKALEVDVEALGRRVSGLSNEVAGLSSSLNAEKTGRKAADAEVKAKEAELTRLNGVLGEVRKERGALQTRADKLERDLSEMTQGRYDAEEMLKVATAQAKKADEEFGKAIEAKENEIKQLKGKHAKKEDELKQQIAQLNHQWEEENSRLERQLSSATKAIGEITEMFNLEREHTKKQAQRIKSLETELEKMNEALKLNKCHCPGLWRHFTIMMGYLKPKEGGKVRQVLGMILNALGLKKKPAMSAGFEESLPKIGEHFDRLVKEEVIAAPGAPKAAPNGASNGTVNTPKGKPKAAGGRRK